MLLQVSVATATLPRSIFLHRKMPVFFRPVSEAENVLHAILRIDIPPARVTLGTRELVTALWEEFV